MRGYTEELPDGLSRLKILQLVYAFYPPYCESGNSRVAYEISKGLVRRGHDVTVCTTNVLAGETMFVPKKKEYNVNGIKVHYHRNLFYKPHACIPLFYSQGVVNEIKENIADYDVIHLHENRFYTSILLHHYAKKYGIPYVLQAHGSLAPTIGRQKLKRIYDSSFGYRLLRDASKVIALNQMEAEQYRIVGVPAEKIVVIPNGIDLSEYADLPPKGCFKKKFGIKEDEKIVLYLGRLHESKGLDLLAYAFSAVSKDLSDVRLVVVGSDDGYAVTFSKLITELGIKGRVLLTGFVEKRDKMAALVDSDIFATPRFHGFPVTFLEACLAGCPIVTTSNELDWIDNNVGYIVKDSSVDLARAISNMLQNKATRERLRNNCRFTIRDFDISTTTFRLEDAYKSVVNE